MTGVNEHAAIITSQAQRIAALERAAARRDHLDALDVRIDALEASGGITEHVPTGDPNSPPTGLLEGQLLWDGDSSWVGGTTPWTALPTYGAQWGNYGGGWQVGQYRKVGDEVQLRGLLNRGSTAPSATICTLPVGFRPPANCLFGCQGYVFGANGLIRVSVYDTGVLLLDDANNQFYPGSPYYAQIGTNLITYLDLSVIKFSTTA
jgi:hypothetical protein